MIPLPPGRELDAEIAEKVMGWTRSKPDHLKPLHKPSLDHPGRTIDDWDDSGPHDYLIRPGGSGTVRDRVAFCGCEGDAEIPRYSTEIAAAWELVEAGIRQDFHCTITAANGGTAYHCEFERRVYIGEPDTFHAEGNTAPLAICLAALKTVQP